MGGAPKPGIAVKRKAQQFSSCVSNVKSSQTGLGPRFARPRPCSNPEEGKATKTAKQAHKEHNNNKDHIISEETIKHHKKIKAIQYTQQTHTEIGK